MEPRYVTHVDDEAALAFLSLLAFLGCKVRVLGVGQVADCYDVVIFSRSSCPRVDPRILNDREIVMASHRLLAFRPNWAKPSPFCHLIRRQAKTSSGGQLVAQQLKRGYESFEIPKVLFQTPWGAVTRICPREDSIFNNLAAFARWTAEVKSLSSG